jgi:tRNA1(Val) A37 N6-methylase TrmN6
MSIYWSTYYNIIKDQNWPECVTEHEFKFLPDRIKQEIINRHNGLRYIELNDNDIEVFYDVRGYREKYDTLQSSSALAKFAVAKDFDVHYTEDIDGRGRYHSQVYPLVLAKIYPGQQFNNCLEWCAGPGFIGFRLIADNIVNSITMMDMYGPALKVCETTWENRPSRLEQKNMETVQGTTVDCLENRLFDLIVANPPNFDNKNLVKSSNYIIHRLTQDPGWQTHTDFFLNIKKNLMPDGKILLMKHKNGSQPSDHINAIRDGGLKINRIITVKSCLDFYFMEVTYP